MAETNVLINRTKNFTKRGIFQLASELYQRKFSRPDEMVSATYEHIYLTGWAPDPGQQKASCQEVQKCDWLMPCGQKKPACRIDHGDKCFISLN